MDTEPLDGAGNDKPLFSESFVPGGAKTLLIAAAIGVLIAVVGFAISQAIVATVGMTIAIFSLPLLAADRYLRIALDRRQLTVGRDTIGLDTIDQTHGIERGEDALDDATLVALMNPFRGMRERGRYEDLRILGGSYALPQNGAKWLVIKQTDGTRYVIPVRRRDQLAAALDQALTG